jgi:hypothetical protein
MVTLAARDTSPTNYCTATIVQSDLYVRRTPACPFATMASLVAQRRGSGWAIGEGRLMALTQEEARLQAEVIVDAFNRRDPDPILALLHGAVTHRGPFVAKHLGHERGLQGTDAQREFLHWLWAKEPALRHVLEEVFVGSEGYAYLTHSEQDGTRYVFVYQLNADGLIRDFHVYSGSPPAH